MTKPAARKMYKFRTVVEGNGQFPLDMLRYDMCWPRTEADSAKCQPDWTPELRRVEVESFHDYAQWHPTEGRWSSFGWKIVEHKPLGG